MRTAGVFAITDSRGAENVTFALLFTFGASLLFYRLFATDDERAKAQGNDEELARQRTTRVLSMTVALVALPGAVVALVDGAQRVVERVRLENTLVVEVSPLVEDFIDYAELLTTTAFFHGVAVGIWSNGWILDHGSVDREGSPLATLKYLIPLLSAIAAFAPRFQKFTDQKEKWFPPQDDLFVIDLFAYASEILLVVIATLAITRRLFTYKKSTAKMSSLLRSLRKNQKYAKVEPAGGKTDAASAFLWFKKQSEEQQPMLLDCEKRDLPSLSNLKLGS